MVPPDSPIEARTLDDDEARGILNSLMGDLPGVVYRCRNDPRWTMLALTRSVEELTGWTAAELLGDGEPGWRDLIHPADVDYARGRVDEAVEAGRPFRLTYRIRCADGTERWVLEQGRAVDGEQGDTVLTGYIQEVDEPWIDRLAAADDELEAARRETRQLQLLQSVTRLVNRERSFEDALAAVVEEVGRALSFSVVHVFLPEPGGGLSSSDIWYLDEGVEGLDAFVEATDGDQWDPTQGLPGRVMERGQAYWIEDVEADPDFLRISPGSTSPVRSGLAVPVLSETRTLAVLELYTHEPMTPDPGITRRLEQIGVQLGRVWERQEADRAERVSQELFRELAERADMVFWTADPEGRILYLSSGLEHLLTQAHLEELPLVDWRDVVRVAHPDDKEELRALLSRPDRAPYEIQYRVLTADGQIRWIHQRAFPMRDEAGRVVRIGGLAEDVTEARHFGARLEETTRLLEQTFASLEEAVFVVDPRLEDGRGIVEANLAAERMFGWTRDEMLGASTALIHPTDESFRRFAAEGDPALERDGVFHAAYPLKRKDGTVFPAEQTVTLLDPERGMDGGVVSVVRDVSRREALEQQLVQAQKMEAVGRLAGGIAHDFNNLLTVIRAQVDFFLLDLPPDGTMAEEMRVIREAADRAAELTRQLLAFSREQVLRPRVVDLNEIVAGMRSLLRRILGEDIEIRTDMKPDLPPIRVDRGQLEQVVMNLAVNAREAMPRGGLLTLGTEVGEPTPQERAYLPHEDPSSVVRLTVSDTGIGMDEATRSQVFEPFFTTKGEEGGTGLGLSMSYGIVKQSGGAILVESEPGRGTTFRMCFLPSDALAGEAEGGEGEPPPSPPADELKGTILVVEDDASVLRVARKILERAGLEVRTASDTPTARALLEEWADEIDLLLTDLVLPGAGGRSLVDLVLAELPDLSVVVMSGYAEGSPGKRDDLPEAVGFIQKPFTPDGLVEAVRKHLVP